jgi:hypothetical chaperone protein
MATMPTAVFYRADTPAPARGRAAGTAAPPWRPTWTGIDGRLMRSMKSMLGSSLLDQRTDVGGGRACATATWSPATCAT